MIQQIIPATSWHAVFVDRGEDAEIELFTIPLSCWGLVEAEDRGDAYRYITGFGADDVIDSCDDVENFLGYVHESDPKGSEKYREAAERHIRIIDERERKHQRLRAAGFRYGTSRGNVRWLSPRGGGWLSTRAALEELQGSLP
jgi:hypothetical protein